MGVEGGGGPVCQDAPIPNVNWERVRSTRNVFLVLSMHQ